ncbi:MAG: peptidoglycan editing factor PgeF [Muribaculaceae bacterium]|nr:peptidoglycan editing factor PgeF [Muribaculaceae bacterium]
MKMTITRSLLPREYKEIIDFGLGKGGTKSDEAYSGDTVCDYTGDSIEHIFSNRYALVDALELPGINYLIQPLQSHTNNVELINGAFFQLSLTERAKKLQNVDAIVTNIPNIAIGINTADCVPILLYDPVKHIIAAAHAGWRGTASKIAERTIEAMQALGSNPADIVAGIDAAISQECYEVGDEVIEAISTTGIDLDSAATRNSDTGKYHIDLKECNRQIIINCGVKAENIKVSPYCTYSNPQKYYSARRQGINSGRNFTGIMIKR